MKAKKIITIIMALTLALGIVGCGNDEESKSTSTTTKDESSDSKKDSDMIEQNEKNLFELGDKQTKDIKKVLETYGVKVNFRSERTTDTAVSVAKDKSECSTSGGTGYTVSTTADVKPNDGGENDYSIGYGSYINKEGEPYYVYDIDITCPDAQEFKMDNFKMLKDLITAQFGEGYDFASFESWVQTHFAKMDKGTQNNTAGRDTGVYREGLIGGEKSSVSKKNSLRGFTYRISLREESK